MPTVLRLDGLRFMILTDDHPPPHVHVYGDGEAKIEIGRDELPPFVIYAQDMKGAVQRRAVQAIALHRSELLAKWIEIHG